MKLPNPLKWKLLNQRLDLVCHSVGFCHEWVPRLLPLTHFMQWRSDLTGLGVECPLAQGFFHHGFLPKPAISAEEEEWRLGVPVVLFGSTEYSSLPGNARVRAKQIGTCTR